MENLLTGGISTSLLFSVFEAWYVSEHRDAKRLNPDWIQDTFSTSTFANGLIAIAAGIVANFLAETLGLGPCAPFIVAILPCLVCYFVVTTYWDENHGDRNVDIIGGYKSGLAIIFDDSNILCIGIVQSIVESSMYIFVFLWTPVLSEGKTHHIGTWCTVKLMNSFCFVDGSSKFSLSLQETISPHSA